ncbi:MAG: OmpA family protein [Verrucomicrobia bacterium]|nr:OmpA family protein [Leptolyngbya sp. ES-bin-22]
MRSSMLIGTSSLVLTLAIAACSNQSTQTKQEAAQLQQTQIQQYQPNKSQLNQTQPQPTQTEALKPGEYKPGEYKTGVLKPGAYKPGEYKPEEYKPGEYKPGSFKDGKFVPGTFKPAQFKPAQFQPSKFIPGKFMPAAFKPGAFKPGAFEPVRVQDTPEEIRILLAADVLFDFDKDNIRSDAADALRNAAVFLKDHANSPVRIEGHTDSKGTDSYNQALSGRRAASVKQWLVAQAMIASSRLSTNGAGESSLIAPNVNSDGSDNADGRQQNRRVEIRLRK